MAAGWVETFTVYVTDAHLRPINNATVLVNYQYNSVVGRRTLTFHTDQRGVVQVTISNVESFSSLVDRRIRITACYNGVCKSVDKQAGDVRGRVFLKLPVYYLTVHLKSFKQMPIPDMEVRIGDLKARTNAEGKARFQVAAGKHTVEVNVGGGVYSKEINVQEDSAVVLTVPLYDVYITILNDMDQALEADVVINGVVHHTNGSLTIHNYPSEIIRGQAIYGYASKDFEANLSIDNHIVVAFDQTPPIIEQVNATRKADNIIITIKAKDGGKRPSGVNSHSVRVDYMLNGVVYRKACHQAARHVYVCSIPATQEVLSITAVVEDNDGNVAKVKASVSSYQPHQNNNKPEPRQEQSGGINWMWIAAGVIILLVILVIVLKGVME